MIKKTIYFTMFLLFAIAKYSYSQDDNTFVKPILQKGFGELIEISAKIELVENKNSKIPSSNMYLIFDAKTKKSGEILCFGFDDQIQKDLEMLANRKNKISMVGYESIDVLGVPSGVSKYMLVSSRSYSINNIFIVVKINDKGEDNKK